MEKNQEKSQEEINYISKLKTQLEKAYAVASQARKKGLDPSDSVEIKIASDVAARVEGIVGPPGISQAIRELEKQGKSREIIAFEIVKKIVAGEFGQKDKRGLIEQAVRTGVGILTEGVLVAPTEGISDFKIRKNQDGSDYLAIYFAGPIRSAGGTVAALSVVLGDVARRELGISDYRPTEKIINRYVEEIEIYGTKSAHLQYFPSEEDIRYIVSNCPVCIDGDPTEKEEVAVNRDIPEIETNKVRSGIALVICEGIAQKAAKVYKYTKNIGLDWQWMEKIIKVKSKEADLSAKLKADFVYLEESVAGRAIFAYPSTKGGWRLRYGRTRATGIMGKAINPASMVILDEFLAIGTQMKVERPGKSCVVTPCDTILGPTVKLKDGSVVQVNTLEEAYKIKNEVVKILFLGDLLVSVGDFIKSNHPLLPSAWCEERFEAEAKRAGLQNVKHDLSAGEALKISRKYDIPLHPKYTYFWNDITHKQLKELALWLRTGKPHYSIFRLEKFELEYSTAKAVLEELCVPHKVSEGKIIIDGEHAFALLKTMGIMVDKKIIGEKFDSLFDEKIPILELLKKISGIKIANKAPTYIGSRMGRPEKAKERKMKRAVNVLFPVGISVDRNASVSKVYKKLKEKSYKEGRGVEVEIARMRCKTCGSLNFSIRCMCGGECEFEKTCPTCKKTFKNSFCPNCKKPLSYFDSRNIDLLTLFERACEKCEVSPEQVEVKGVEGLFSSFKIPEKLEKGILRAKHKVFVSRDGTCRFDATDVPLTHFKPSEISVGIEKLKELGYDKDIYGKPLENEEQILALYPQDIILSRNGAKYLYQVACFIDDLIEKFYGLERFYNLKSPEDLVGHLAIGLSPHTSAGVLCRIIGFTDAHVGFGHPYFHCAKRRNTDGDEDSVILLMDGLLNFSYYFLPSSRGGTMDAPLVLSTTIDPEEIDDEVHAMEVCESYPAEFYELADKFSPPSEVNIENVKSRLGKPEQFFSLGYTHNVSNIAAGPHQTAYLKFKDMEEKIFAQMTLQEKIRAVDSADAAERLLLHHFLPDLYGNLRSFSQQSFRCLDCKAKFRRVPLIGKCPECGGKLLQTIHKGGITKYLEYSAALIEKYNLPNYLKQRIELLRKDIDSVFAEEKEPQKGLAEFM